MTTDDCAGARPVSSARSPEWLVGGGAMGELIRSTDWSSTPFGPRERWPAAMRAVVNLILGSQFPMALLWGRELLFLYNDAYREIAGERHPRALGRSTREIWPEVWHINEPIFAAVTDRGETFYLEDKLFPIERQGRRQEAFFTLCYSPVRGDDGGIAGALVTLFETTRRVREHRALEADRVRTEAAVRRERDLLGRIIERIPVMVTIYDPALQSFRLNDELRRVLGWTDEDTRSGDRMALGDPGRTCLEDLRRIMGSSEPGWRELEVAAKDGSRVATSWATIRLPDDTWVGIGIDLRDRIRAEAVLRKSEERFRALVTASSEVLYRLSPDWKEMRQLDSRAFLASTDEPSRTWLEEYIRPEDQPQVKAAIGEAIQTKSIFELEHRVRRADGSLGWALSRAVPMLDARGEIVEWFGAASDITERKRAEAALRRANEQLVEADRRKNEFLAVLSHELRNPLAPIRNSVYILERATPGGEQADRARQVIDRQAQHMTRLVEDLLDVTRISRGKVSLQRERVDLNALARGTAEDHREVFARKGVHLAVDEAAEALWVDGDRTRLAQVIGNLLNNSAKFTPGGGRTVLSVEANALGKAVVRVRDDGAGMSAETLTHLFEPFMQAPQTIARTRGGLGLGLALVKGLVEMHGGEVQAHSEGEGRGSEFTLTLPLLSPARPKLAVVPPPGRASRARRVLVVEDNADAAESLREALALGDHEVAVAYSGPEGIAAAHTYKPDVVLCDIGLPGIDGYGVAGALRADPDPAVRSTHLIALSGYALQEDITKSLEAGFDRHMAKPPSIEALQKLLAEGPVRATAG